MGNRELASFKMTSPIIPFFFLIMPLVLAFSNSNETKTSKTTARLWSMDPKICPRTKDEDRINEEIPTALLTYTRVCCREWKLDRCEGSLTHPLRQMGYWAWIPRIKIENESYMTYLKEQFDPSNKELSWTQQQEMCGLPTKSSFGQPREPSDGLDYENTTAVSAGVSGGIPDEFPYFALPITDVVPNIHVESILLEQMAKRAKLQYQVTDKQKEPVPTDFFLFTVNSPCTSGKSGGCMGEIFRFTDVEIYENSPPNEIEDKTDWNKNMHKLNVGFAQWFKYGKPTLEPDVGRLRFCGMTRDITHGMEHHKKTETHNFAKGLSFVKIRKCDATSANNQLEKCDKSDCDFEKDLEKDPEKKK